LSSYGNEDQELAWRMREAGSSLHIDFRAVVHHLGPQVGRTTVSQREAVIARSRERPELVRAGRFLPT
jgi:hypothetical protein